MISHAYYSGLRLSGLAALARRLRSGGVILCYHNVVGSGAHVGEPAVHLGAPEFERQVLWLAAHYRVISLTEMVERARAGGSVRGTAALTFDDAYQGVFDHAWPALRAAGLPATVYVPTSFMAARDAFWWDHPLLVQRATEARRGRWLGDLHGDGHLIMHAEGVAAVTQLPSSHRPAAWDTIRRAAAEGLELGLHSATHRNLTRLTDDELRAEIVDSRAVLRLNSGVNAATFAYPYGLWDTRVRDRLRDAGFASAVTLDSGFNSRDTDLLALRRVNVPSSISPAAFEAWAAGLRPRA